MKVLMLNPRTFVFIFFMALLTANGQEAKKITNKQLQNRILVKTLSQQSLQRIIGVDGQETKEAYIFDKNESLSLPKKMYINDMVVRVVSKEEDLAMVKTPVLVIDAMNMDNETAVVSLYNDNLDPNKRRLNPALFIENSDDSKVANVVFEDYEGME